MPIKDRDARNAYLREWSAKNKDKVRKYSYDHLAKNPKKKLLKSSRHNAKLKGIENTLTEDDLTIPEYCPYLKIKLTTEVAQKNTASTVSLDRIDSSKGYTPDNVQVISRLANLMKSYATEEQLIQFAKSVLEIHDK